MTTTREAALEAAAKNLVWAAQTSGGTAGRDEGLVAACDRMEAALSTPATEPQGYVDELIEKLRAGVVQCGLHEDNNTELFDIEDANEAMFEAAQALAARPAPQPAADMRVVVKPLVWKPEDAPCTRFKAEALGGHMMIVELDPETHPGTYSVGIDLGGLCFKFILAEYDDFLPKYTAPAKFEGIEAAKAAAQADYETRILSAIIGTATPSPSDKIAEAAIDRCMQEIEDIICEADVSYPAGRDAGTSIDFDRDAVLAALRALAGKGE